MRAVASAAGTSMTVVFNLEKTGDVTHLSVAVLSRIASAVGLSIIDLLPSPQAPARPASEPALPTDTAENAEVASALLAHPGGLRLETLALLLDEATETTAGRLRDLDRRLRPFGLGVAMTKASVTLVGLPRVRLADAGIRDVQKRLGNRKHITRSEAKSIYAVYRGTATLKGLRSNADGHLRTGRLVNAGIIQPGPREIDPAELTADVRYSLVLDE